MILNCFKRSKRPVSFALILSFVFELAFPFSSRSATLASGGGTVASSLSSMVDGYTGDFHYSVPLVTVPGPNGESVSISANYRAGITVNQKASWMGLGWDYNPGEISRQVVNAPDDYNGVPVNQYVSSNNGAHTEEKTTAMFGSIYNNNINTNPYGGPTVNTKSGDNTTSYYSLSASQRCGMIEQTSGPGSCYSISSFDPTSNASYRFNKHTVPYTSLAYDQYSVSGSGIGGSIHPYHLGEVQIHPEMGAGINNWTVSSKKCQFYFENSTTLNVAANTCTNSIYVNQSTNRIHSGTFVKYFTNDEINYNGNLYSSTNPSGYLDYKPVTNMSADRRPSSSHNPDIIGAFQVTTPAGMTYHYSLPVYELENLNASFDGNGNSTATHLASCMYATSWKLTAITGPDYEDVNGNYTADEGDSGYWISYNYSLWNSSYDWASQRYNAKSDGLISPKMVNLITSGATGNQYKRNSSLSFGKSQVYALNYIKTSTHTAYFVKSVREDEQSYINVLHTSSEPAALLKLDRVVLMSNEQSSKDLMINSTSLSGDSRFDYTNCSSALSDPNFVNMTRYTANKTAIDAVALTTAELGFNYSLAKKYIGNINNVFGTSAQSFVPWPFTGHTIGSFSGSWYKQVTGYTSTSATGDNGKLTLKKISIYNLKGEKVTPSVDFAYDESSSTKNPDFNVDKTDLWGYYKNDYVNSHYVTAVSKNDVDAWSLKEINTSLGGKIKVTYESDRYDNEGFNGDVDFHGIVTGDPNGDLVNSNTPHLIFPMSNINLGTGEATFYDADFGQYSNLVSEPTSDPGYTHNMYTIFNQLEQCTHPIVLYNNGNSSYYPPVYRHLMRYGNKFTANASGSGTGPYSTLLVSSVPEYNFDCYQPGYDPSTVTTNDVGVNHVVAFRSYLYGGGVRVNKIEVNDPFSGNTFTQKFDYGKGYCPIVPKPNALSTDNGPSNHDVIMNLKPMMAPQLTGLVGYSKCTQYALDQNNRSTGAIEQVFNNDLVMSPLAISMKSMTPQRWPLCMRMQYSEGSSCKGIPSVTLTSPDPLCTQYLTDYKIKIDLSLTNNTTLGKALSVSDGVSSTNYSYSTVSINESYAHPKTEIVTYTNYMTYPATLPTGASYNQCKMKYSFNDEYQYNASSVSNTSTFLSSTTTIKDGITMTEEIHRASYTGDPYYTKTTDPTRGVYESYTSPAYLQTVTGSSTLLYPAMDLKSRNESNRNLLTGIASTKTEKDGAYIISESKATYSNVYPICLIGGSTSNVTKPWYHLNETYERLLDDDVPVSTAALSTDWRKISTNTLYDVAYNCIEQQGLNGRKAASRWGYAGLYKLADISNANYNSFTFSGFEDPMPAPGNTVIFGGEVRNAQTAQFASVQTINNVPYTIQPHTGTRLAGMNPGQAGPLFNTSRFEVGRTYIAKVWVHKFSPGTAALNIQLSGEAGGSPYSDTKTIMRSNPANVTVGDWVLMSTELEVPANFNIGATHSMIVSLTNAGASGKAYFDDLAFHPKDAVMTGNVYNEKTGALIAQLDNDNFATIYNYDNAMRLTSALKEYSGGIKKVTESIYHYAKP